MNGVEEAASRRATNVRAFWDGFLLWPGTAPLVALWWMLCGAVRLFTMAWLFAQRLSARVRHGGLSHDGRNDP